MTPRSQGSPAPTRYKWEEHGPIVVASLLPPANEHTRALVCKYIQNLIQEFTLPLRVQTTPPDEADMQLVRQLVVSSTDGSVLDGDKFERDLRLMRAKGRLQRALVALVDVARYERIRYAFEDVDGRALYGYSVHDGLSLLLNYEEPPVRHEISHMLGLGGHCTDIMCVMNYKCPRPGTFCQKCKMALVDRWH